MKNYVLIFLSLIADCCLVPISFVCYTIDLNLKPVEKLISKDEDEYIVGSQESVCNICYPLVLSLIY